VIRLFLSTVLLAAAASGQSEIRGRVVDAAGGIIPRATVRLIPSGRNGNPIRAIVDETGMFRMENVSAGSYSLGVFANAFREYRIREIVVEAGRPVDLGSITLQLAGCDAPGVTCDWVLPDGDPDSKKIVFSGYLKIGLGCGADLDRGEISCKSKTLPGRIDVKFVRDRSGKAILMPANGAGLSTAGAQKINSSASGRDVTPLQIHGLGPGNDFYVKTSQGKVAHFFLTSEVDETTVDVVLWCVTRN
jgi:hypothetical protein